MGFAVLVGVSLAAGSQPPIHDGPAPPLADSRAQDDSDDLGLADRGAGRLADSQQDLSSDIRGRILGPPAPAAGEAVRRDADGRVTLRAFRLAEPITVDGVLDDPVYEQVPAAEGFVQQEPSEGAPASEGTRVWVLYDADSLYISAELEEEHPERLMANEMRRDQRNIDWGDSFSVIIDTFYDRRNGFLFHTNALGALFDAQVTDERNTNSDWNTVWWVKSHLLEDRYTVEIRIPFRSLRYTAGGPQIWGINFRRRIKHRNEQVFFTPTPQSYSRDGLTRLSNAATLVGVEAPPGSRRMELKPYAIGSQSHVPLRDINNEWAGDVGADFKFGVTDGLTADVTWNTDFAQVEDDETQVNLSRFSLFYPEKREFFLEGQGVFDFGGRQTRVRPFGGDSSRRSDPVLQPVHRHCGRQRGADPGWCAAPRPRRRLPDGPHEHPDRRGGGARRGEHELQRFPDQARHLFPVEYRSHRHPSERERRRLRGEFALRNGRELRPDRQHPHQHLLHGNERARSRDRAPGRHLHGPVPLRGRPDRCHRRAALSR